MCARSLCRLRLPAIAALGHHHIQLASVRRAKCHTYQSTLLPARPSRVVVDRARCSRLAVVVYRFSPCVALRSAASFCPLTHHPSYNIPRARPHLLPLGVRTHYAFTHRQHWTPPCSATPRPKSSRPARLGLRLRTTLPNPTRAIDVIDTQTPPQTQPRR